MSENRFGVDNRLAIFFLFLFIIASFVGVTLLFYLSYSNLEQVNKSKNEELLILKNDIKNYRKLNDEYTDKKLKELLSKNDLLILTKSLWKYELLCNDKIIRSDNVTSSSKATIILKEIKKPSSLPSSIVSLGSITRGDNNDNAKNYITFSNNNYNLKTVENTETIDYIFEFSNLKKGELFEIRIASQLLSELNLNKNIINVLII